LIPKVDGDYFAGLLSPVAALLPAAACCDFFALLAFSFLSFSPTEIVFGAVLPV
jgi:hypothetical protein